RRQGCDRDRRPRRCDPRGNRWPAAGRCAADRRQGPRDRADHRREDAAVQRSRGSGCRARTEGRMSAAPLWTLRAMAEAMRAAMRGGLPESITGLSIDSRTIKAGEAYFAIKGDVHDGHDFVDAALKAGAGLAVVETAQRDKFAVDAPLLVVDDVLEGLRDLARASRARLKGQVIAVTGSVGKTSTKEALRRVLSPQGETHASA